MKAAWLVRWMVCTSILLSSCGGGNGATATSSITPTPTSTPPIIEVTPPPTDVTLNLRPVVATPESTGVQFLIDNSNSIRQDCGEVDGRRFDFVNYMLDILRTTPEPLADNLHVGVSSFGNVNNNGYISLIPPQVVNPGYPRVDKLTVTGDSQNYSTAIQNAVNDINEQSVIIKYLVILTDGGFWKESPTAVLEKLNKITENKDLIVLVGLICPEIPSIQSDIAKWQTNINGVQGSVYVFSSVEDAGRYLLDYLKPFLPYSLAISSTNYLDAITIPGGYTGSFFRYWNKDINSHLSIKETITGDFWDVTQVQSDHSFQPTNGCLQYSLLFPNPGNHWLLFIQAHTFEDLKLILSTENRQPLEIVNNQTRVFNFQIKDDVLSEYDLRNWKDCFQVDIVGPNGSSVPISNGNFSFMQSIDFDTIQGQAQWFPQPFPNPVPIDIKIRFKSKNHNNPAWEVKYPLPIKFEPVFSPPNQTLLTNNNTPEATEVILAFHNVASQPRIFLVSDLSYDQLIDLGNKVSNQATFQQVNFMVKGEASELSFSQPCHLSQGVPNQYSCMKYEQSLPLTYTYTLQTFKHIVEYYRFNRLIFIWKESITTKAKAWECWIGTNTINCDGNITVPDIVPK